LQKRYNGLAEITKERQQRQNERTALGKVKSRKKGKEEKK